MSKEKPVYINVMQYRFPRMAIVSILHRLSGVIIFLLLPFLLYLLHLSLVSSASFTALQQTFLHYFVVKFLLWVMLSAVIFHLLAGIRHLLMDLGFFESLRAGKIMATVVLVCGVLGLILIGAWIW